MALFEKFHILHRDVSVNNTMIYVANIPESEGSDNEVCSSKSSNNGGSNNDGSHHLEALSDEAVENQEDKHAQWDIERQKQIQAGILPSGLLIDFDYMTNLDQTPSSISGDCTIRMPPIFPILTHEFQLGNDSIHVNQHSSQL